jgi:hypothetical protein
MPSTFPCTFCALITYWGSISEGPVGGKLLCTGKEKRYYLRTWDRGGNSGQIWQVTQDLPGDASYRRYTQLQHNEVKFSGIE